PHSGTCQGVSFLRSSFFHSPQSWQASSHNQELDEHLTDSSIFVWPHLHSYHGKTRATQFLLTSINPPDFSLKLQGSNDMPLCSGYHDHTCLLDLSRPRKKVCHCLKI